MSAGGRRALRAALAALFVSLVASPAWALTCTLVPGASELSVADLGRVVFRELATDRAADAATFAGGVCLELADQRVVVEAERFEVSAFASAPTVVAYGARVRSDAWRLAAQRLDFDGERLVLDDASLEADDLVALAQRLEVALETGEVRGRALVAATPGLRVDLAEAVLAGAVLRGSGAVVSTCDCPPSEAALRIEAAGLWLSLEGEGLEIEGGWLVTGALRWPLASSWRLDASDLERLQPPLSVTRDERRGWLLVLPERARAGVALGADVALSAEARPPWRVGVVAEGAGASATFRVSPSAAAARIAAERALQPWLTLIATQRLELASDARLADAALSLRARVTPTLGVGLTHVVRLEAGAALSAQRSGAVEVSTPRAWSLARWETSTQALTSGRLQLGLELGSSGYLTDEGSQLWWALSPRWTLARDDWSLTLAHEQRWVRGSSPFTSAVDRRDPVSLSSLRVGARLGEGPVALDAEVRYDWRDDPLRDGVIGLDRARVALDGPWGDLAGGEARLRGSVELAGVLDPRRDRAAVARFGAQARWPQRDAEFGIDVSVGLLPDAVALRSLVLSVAAPLPLPDPALRVRPFVALDVLPSLRGDGWPELRGHGVALRWETDYGALDLRYRSDLDGSLTTSVGFELPSRSPTLEELRQ